MRNAANQAERRWREGTGAGGGAPAQTRKRGGAPRAVNIEEQPVHDRLHSLGIAYERFTHPPINTAEEGEVHWAGIDAVHCKNLFLRNQKGDRHYLLVVRHDIRVDLRFVAEQVGDGKLSFASPDRLMRYLGVTPGSVSPFGLIHDRERHVRVFLDRELKSAARISCHPNINTATLALTFADFERFLADCGHSVRYVAVTR